MRGRTAPFLVARRRVGWSLLAALLLSIAPAGVALTDPPTGFAAKKKFGKRVLKAGMRGKDVRVLQRSLTRLELRTSVDGRFGKVTRRNVRALERRQGWLPVNGRVSRKEAKRIKRLVRSGRGAATGASGYIFPVADPHSFGGPEARFGAPRSGHAHQGQDIFASCGTPIYAAHAGNVKTSSYQGSAGYYLVVDGLDGSNTVYMHMKKASWAAFGTLLYPGQQIGKVGATGNASGCHLHFEHWTYPGWYDGGYPVDPLIELMSWDSYS
ncbi:MAG: M23 family metallopeptidase [Solirubrobacterales bacterium]